MATEKQIAANRNNAKRSTGPKTAAGKRRSSGNSYRHGLSVHLQDMVKAESIDDIVCALVEKAGGEYESVAALVRAQIELRMIGNVREELLSSLKLENLNPEKLRRVGALDRYDRLARTKRRRALQSISKKPNERAPD